MGRRIKYLRHSVLLHMGFILEKKLKMEYRRRQTDTQIILRPRCVILDFGYACARALEVLCVCIQYKCTCVLCMQYKCACLPVVCCAVLYEYDG